MSEPNTLYDRALAWLEQGRKAAERSRSRSYAVVGLGTFGSTVASELTRFGNHVIGIDTDERRVNALADTLSQGLIVDARDESALRDAGLGDCDVAVIAMASDLEVSILATVNVARIGVPTVWAKAMSRTHHRILSKLGVDRVIHPEEEVGRSVAQMLHNPLVRDYASLGNNRFAVSFIVPPSIEGRKVSELRKLVDFDLRVLGVMRGTEWLGDDDCPSPLMAEDTLLLMGTRANLRRFADTL